MIADSESNVVFVSDTLKPGFPKLYRGLESILATHGIPLETIPGTRQIWCRDFMPVEVGASRFVQFRYEPDYLEGPYHHLRADGEIGPALPWLKKCALSEIVLDGGNVVGGRDVVVLTEKVAEANGRYDRTTLVAELGSQLDVAQVVLIPPEPGDVTGHADGVLRLIDDTTAVVNNYSQVDEQYRRALLHVLEHAGLDFVEIPYRPDFTSFQGMPSATGNYVNFLRVGSLVVVPSYGMATDEEVLSTLTTEFPHLTLASLDCRELAKRGGVLNCCTWTIQRASYSTR
jgi:agmatine/peptidylarginine deiminase